MNFKITSSLSEIVINQLATLKSDSNVKEMIDVTYTYDTSNHTWSYTNSENYTVVNPYSITSNECTKVTTDNCENTIVIPPDTGGGDVPPVDDGDIPPEGDEEYPGATDYPYVFNHVDLGICLLLGASDATGVNICGESYTLSTTNEKLGGSNTYCGESITTKKGSSITNYGTHYDLNENVGYYRPYSLYSHMNYAIMESTCTADPLDERPVDLVSTLTHIVLQGTLACNLLVKWNNYFIDAKDVIKTKNGYDDVQSVDGTIYYTSDSEAEKFADEMIGNSAVNTACLYFSTVESGNDTYYFSNAIDPTSYNKVQSLEEFKSVIDNFKKLDGNTIVSVDGNVEMTFDDGLGPIGTGVTVNEYYEVLTSAPIVHLNLNSSLSTEWGKMIGIISETDINGISRSINESFVSYIDTNSRCKECSDSECPDIYNSDGSVGGVEIQTKFAIICRSPISYDNGVWTYKYSVKCFNKTNNLSAKGYKLDKDINTPDGGYVDDQNVSHTVSYKRVNTKSIIFDAPFPENATRTKSNDGSYSVSIKNGIFNTFIRSNNNDYKGGTIYSLIEDKIAETWIIDGDALNPIALDTYNYLKSGNSIKQCELGSSPSFTENSQNENNGE